MVRVTQAMKDGNFIENIALSVGTEDTNVVRVTLTVKQVSGALPVKVPGIVCYLAEAADGLVLEPSSGGVAAGSVGSVVTLLTDDSVFMVVPGTGGKAEVDVTQTGSDTLYFVAVSPDGTKVVSSALSFS